MEREPLTHGRLLELVAEIYAGAQVPMSMGVLGTARKPLVELGQALNLFGWVDKDQVLAALRRAASQPGGSDGK